MLVGGLEHLGKLSIYWECRNPNWRKITKQYGSHIIRLLVLQKWLLFTSIFAKKKH